MPLSDRSYVEQFKKTVFVRDSRLTLYTKEQFWGHAIPCLEVCGACW